MKNVESYVVHLEDPAVKDGETYKLEMAMALA